MDNSSTSFADWIGRLLRGEVQPGEQPPVPTVQIVSRAETSPSDHAPAGPKPDPEARPQRERRQARSVVGESHYQDALAQIAGPKRPEGYLHQCRAVLTPEPDNPHDANAVRVSIDGLTVGYLPRGTAKRFGKVERSCPAQITGGWREWVGRTWSEGHYGVELDLRREP